MKKLLFISLSLLFTISASAQLRFGLKGGISTTDVDASDLNILGPNGTSDLLFQLENANYGVHAGLLIQAQIGTFFFQPEILYNSNSADFRVTDTRNGQNVERILRESYQNIDIPLMMGFKLGPIRLQGGPVGHLFLSSNSDLVDISGYTQTFDNLTYGWQAGLGIDIWQIVIDIKYEGNFDNYGYHFTIDGDPYSFSKTPSRLIGSIGFVF